MKKRIALTLALAMILVSVSAFAETPVRKMYDSVFNLLFDTNNVTLTGHAEFSLDGEWFKTADAVYIQDGVNSRFDWKLLSPRWDGSERESGYTVIEASVPKAEMLNYVIDLRAMTQGRGSFEFAVDRYEEVPGAVAQKVIAEAKANMEEEE